MDDLMNGETMAPGIPGQLATLPPPDTTLAQLRRRETQLEGWLARADQWAVARAGGRRRDVVVEYPRDTAVVIALGVPCSDCFALVYAEGQDGHHVRFGAEAGRHWAALIRASCRRAVA
jgi:hypothetical protein